MSLKVAIQMDPIGPINIDGDSTFRIMEEAQARGTAGGLRLASPLSAVDVAVVNAYRDGALGLR